MMVTLSQQYNVGEKKPTVILDTNIVVTNGYVIPVAYSFLNIWSKLSAEYDMDQPGVAARTSEEVKRRENDTFPVLVPARECSAFPSRVSLPVIPHTQG